MKGVLKGFKYISTMFEEEQEDEIQIGLPTDVKHVAHIGMDGPATESPSWMKEYTPERPKSAPLDSKGQPIDSSSQKTSTDTELPKASRRRHSVDSLAFDDSDRGLSTKSRGSRRHHKKVSADGNSVSKSSRSQRHHRKHSISDQEGSSTSGSVTQDLNGNGDVPESTSPSSPTPRKLPDIPKKSRRKKVTDEISKMTSKAKAIAKPSSDGGRVPTPTTTDNTSCPFSDPGSVGTDATTTTITCDNESCHISTKPSRPQIVQEEKNNIVGCLENSA